MFNPEFLTSDSEAISTNSLIQYLQEQSPDVLQRVARSASSDIQDIIRHNVQGLLGVLPGEHFDVKITANRDHLAVAGIFHCNGDGSPGINGMDGICQQIQQYLSYLIGVTPDRIQGWFYLPYDFNTPVLNLMGRQL